MKDKSGHFQAFKETKTINNKQKIKAMKEISSSNGKGYTR